LALAGDTGKAVAAAAGRGVGRAAEVFEQLNPDIVLVLGDRYEILAAAVAALLMNIPIAHLHGGEVTEGAVDDSIRHALSKMAALHFAAAEPYAARLRQLGEDPARIHMVGPPALDAIAATSLMDREQLGRDLGIDLSGRFLVVTYHPVTLDGDFGLGGLQALLAVLDRGPDTAIVFTGVNGDAGHVAIGQAVAGFVAARPRRRTLVASLGQRRYLSAVKAADAVVGNSSSGLLEAPALGTPTVNIGDRQKGRLKAASVIDCGVREAEIEAAMAKALAPSFRAAARLASPATGGAAGRIVDVLKSVDPAQLSRKRFHDIIGA
jgi:UDP-N-acetylglucosamine 2-epimerase (non-hydrolysing)